MLQLAGHPTHNNVDEDGTVSSTLNIPVSKLVAPNPFVSNIFKVHLTPPFANYKRGARETKTKWPPVDPAAGESPEVYFQTQNFQNNLTLL